MELDDTAEPTTSNQLVTVGKVGSPVTHPQFLSFYNVQEGCIQACRVCMSTKRLSLYFGAEGEVCQSCKAFFMRTVRAEKELKCKSKNCNYLRRRGRECI